ARALVHLGQAVHDHLTGHVALGMTAHAVRHRPQPDLGPHEHGVLVVAADLARVGNTVGSPAQARAVLCARYGHAGPAHAAFRAAAACVSEHMGESHHFAGVLVEPLAEADAAGSVQRHLLAAQEGLVAAVDEHVGAVGALVDDEELVAAELDAH